MATVRTSVADDVIVNPSNGEETTAGSNDTPVDATNSVIAATDDSMTSSNYGEVEGDAVAAEDAVSDLTYTHTTEIQTNLNWSMPATCFMFLRHLSF